MEHRMQQNQHWGNKRKLKVLILLQMSARDRETERPRRERKREGREREKECEKERARERESGRQYVYYLQTYVRTLIYFWKKYICTVFSMNSYKYYYLKYFII